MKLLLRTAIFAAACSALSVSAQTKWDLASAYAATNFHTVNLNQFAADVDKATGGKLKITVHANAALFKAPEIKRAVHTGGAQAGEILLANFQNEWQICGAIGGGKFRLQLLPPLAMPPLRLNKPHKQAIMPSSPPEVTARLMRS